MADWQVTYQRNGTVVLEMTAPVAMELGGYCAPAPGVNPEALHRQIGLALLASVPPRPEPS